MSAPRPVGGYTFRVYADADQRADARQRGLERLLRCVCGPRRRSSRGRVAPGPVEYCLRYGRGAPVQPVYWGLLAPFRLHSPITLRHRRSLTTAPPCTVHARARYADCCVVALLLLILVCHADVVANEALQFGYRVRDTQYAFIRKFAGSKGSYDKYNVA